MNPPTAAPLAAVVPGAAPEAAPRYRRILLKLSGEALLGERQYGVDPAFCAFVAQQVAAVHEMGVQVGIVVGGGNIFRGLAASAKGSASSLFRREASRLCACFRSSPCPCSFAPWLAPAARPCRRPES